MTFYALPVLLLALLWRPSHAYAVTGEALYQKWLAFDVPNPTDAQAKDVQFCGGYLVAAYEFIGFDNHRLTTAGKPVAPYEICFPDATETREIIPRLPQLHEKPSNPPTRSRWAWRHQGIC